MARLARADVFDPLEVSTFHCINRCVRRAWLCGRDPLTGRDHEHRKRWIEERMRFLARGFGIDVLGFSILSSHFHVVLRNRPDVVATWSDTVVARRWLRLCPIRKRTDGSSEDPSKAELDSIRKDPERLAEIRRRLSDISWWMRMVAEKVARDANREEECAGRFWQGRFKAVKLVDDAAILACCVYVDLNPIRAAICCTPEASDHTSVQRRIEQRSCDQRSRRQSSSRATTQAPADWLAPIELTGDGGDACRDGAPRCSDRGFLAMSVDEYLTLLDWTGRQLVAGKQGAIPADLAPILMRLGVEPGNWLQLAGRFGRLFHVVAGSPDALDREQARCQMRGRPRRRSYHAPGRHLLSRPTAR